MPLPDPEKSPRRSSESGHAPRASTDKPESLRTLAPSYTPEPPHAPDTVTPEEGDAYPDGGVRAWATVAGAFLALACTFGQLSSFGTFQAWYATHQLASLPPSTISWIGALQLWVFFFSGGFVGRIFDTYGPRVLMLPGTALLVASTLLTSVCAQFYQYALAQGVLFGLGVALLFYPALAAVSTHFRRYRATALGIAAAGSGVGGVVYPILLQRLFTHTSFPWSLRISSLLTLTLCSLSCLLTSSLPLPPSSSPSSFSLSHFRDPPYLLLCSGSALIALGLFIPNFYLSTYAASRDIPTAYILATLNALSIPGRILPSLLADSCGRLNILVPSALLTGLTTLIGWPLARNLGGVLGYAGAYGFCSGAFNALIIPAIASLSPQSQIGVRIGVLYSLLAFPLAGEPAAGALLRASGGYGGVVVLSGASVLAGAVCYAAARVCVDRRVWARV